MTTFLLLLLAVVSTLGFESSSNDDIVRIFLSGDVMLGRGVDRILSYPNKPKLPNGKTTDHYIKIAEKKNGISFPSHSITSKSDYIWGDLIDGFKIYSPDIKLINLETSITTSDDNWVPKDINYRMNPSNIYTLQEMNNDNRLICNIANNHVLDWGYNGLKQTLSTLQDKNILFCGAGNNIYDALKPAMIEITDKKCRIFVFGFTTISAMTPLTWNATNNHSGIAMIDPYNIDDIPWIINNIKTNVFQKTRDKFRNIIILSIHWGGNWGFEINDKFIEFAHGLIDYDEDDIGIDMIYGHSSHHIKGFEIYKNKAIFYGLGDLLNDYEGIPQHKKGRDIFNPNLSFMYFVDINTKSGDTKDIILKGVKVKNFQIKYVRNQDKLNWLQQTIKQQSERFGIDLLKCNNDKTIRFKQCPLKPNAAPRKTIQSEIDSGIEVMCNGEYEANDGLYAIGMYYKLYNDHDTLSITQCIQNTLKYLKTVSVSIANYNDGTKKAELIDDNIGNTALTIMGMIEICAVNDNICNEYLDELILWINGLIMMNKNNKFYDTQIYLVFAQILKFRKDLYPFIDKNDVLWNIIMNIVDGLDEYYIEYRDDNNNNNKDNNSDNNNSPYWLIQSWLDRWSVLNQQYPNDEVNNFMNRYIVLRLIKKKLEIKMDDELNCILVQVLVDVLYAIQTLIDDSQYKKSNNLDSLQLMKEDVITKIQLFQDEEAYLMDTTMHCVCALIKVNGVLQTKLGSHNIESIIYKLFYNQSFAQRFMTNDLIISLGCFLCIGSIIILAQKQKQHGKKM